MNEKLTYDQWKEKYSYKITDEFKNPLKKLYGIDVEKEIEEAMKKEYQKYINGFYEIKK